jgi:FAD-dependent oxidoreductase domain-containing protein 1
VSSSSRSLLNSEIKTDVLVIGAGVVGSAIALGLTKLGQKNVLVVDLDLSGEWSSSELNAGGVRGTWSKLINLQTSQFSIRYFESVADQVGYHASGYLWMHRPETFDAALKAREIHIANGWEVDVLDVAGIQSKVPYIDKISDLAGALYGRKDGLINPNRLKEHYREEASSMGATFSDGIWIRESRVENGEHVLSAFQFHSQINSEQKRELLIQNPKSKDQFDESLGRFITIRTKQVVNAAGAWAPELAKILGYSSPSKPLRRQISLFHARDVDLTRHGMVIDPSGVYFHPEAVYGLAGFADPSEAPGFNFAYDGAKFFEEFIWPALYERATVFESLKHVSGWAGLYENSPDHHAIVGRAEVAKGEVFEAHSFSGHGVMQSYAVGIALPELMLRGNYETLDLTELSSARFKSGIISSGETWVI